MVVLITWINGKFVLATLDLSSLSLPSGVQLFLVGMFAISAMFLPGISGSTILLIFGMYIPIMNAIKNTLHFNLAYVPSLCLFALGVLIGAITIVKGIQVCLIKYRPQIVYAILGMMIGSFYAIVQGPTTLSVPMQAMHISSFHPIACVFGLVLVFAMEVYKRKK